MASIKNLKKDINFILGDLIGECNVWELENPSADTNKTEAIVDEVVVIFDGLIAEIHDKSVSNRKTHFKAISAKLEEKAKEIATKINSL